jgi:hypothetical protein
MRLKKGKKIKDNCNTFINTIVDDVAFGVFLKDVNITNIGHFYKVPNLNGNYKPIEDMVDKIIFL